MWAIFVISLKAVLPRVNSRPLGENSPNLVTLPGDDRLPSLANWSLYRWSIIFSSSYTCRIESSCSFDENYKVIVSDRNRFYTSQFWPKTSGAYLDSQVLDEFPYNSPIF
jgi:hypothetical protein